MKIPLFLKLEEQQLITPEELQRIKDRQTRPVALQWELLTALYAGILLLCTGLGVLIYQHIDTIGHMAIIAAMAVVCAGCFAWCIKRASGFSREKVAASHVLNDYLLLLGCLLFVILVGYTQFIYHVFGERWSLAAFVPVVVLFATAYYFDHMGVLSLAVTNLAAWAGITATPLGFFKGNDFSDERLIYTGIFLGILLLVLVYLTVRAKVKEHFSQVYRQFGLHILLISLLCGLFHFEEHIALWFFLNIVVLGLCYWEALRKRSYYILVVAFLYAYVAVSDMVFYLMGHSHGDIEISLVYLVASAIALVMTLIHYSKKFKQDAGL